MKKKLFTAILMSHCFLYAKYHSEYRQDEYIDKKIFRGKTKGFFVDIGAYDGVRISNSLYFEELGWTGICFEPDPRQFAALKKNRNCILYNVAVGGKDGTAKFIQHPLALVSGLDRTYQAQHREIFNVVNGERFFIDVEVVKLNDILESHNVKYVDLLSIDTEGAEHEIIESIDFDSVYFHVIVLENHYEGDFFRNFLREKGFNILWRLNDDEVYVNLKSS